MVQWLADLLKGVCTFLWTQLADAASVLWQAISTLLDLTGIAARTRPPAGKLPLAPPSHTAVPLGKTGEEGDPPPWMVDTFATWSESFKSFIANIPKNIRDPLTAVGQSVHQVMEAYFGKETPGYYFMSLIGTIRYAISVTSAAADYARRQLEYHLNKLQQPAIPSVHELAAMSIRRPEAYEIFRELAQLHGYSAGAFSLIIDNARAYPDLGTLRDLHFRILPEAGLSHDDVMAATHFYLRAHGYEQEDRERIIASWYWYPSPLDLVRFVVREVFDPEYRKIHYDPYKPPPKYLELVDKAGMPEETATWYWDAHWELPSVSMAFEMLHRGVIDEEDLDRLLAAQDVMPSWRDAIKRISYHPYTRVDIRRMYKLNVLAPEELKRAYMDAGYDEEHAQNLTEFTILDALGKERTAARSTLDRLFLRHLLSEQELRDGYAALRFNPDAIDMMVQEITIRRQDEYLETRTETIHSLYIVGDLDETQARAELAKIGQDAAAADLAVARWRAERVRLSPKIPVQDLTNWLRNSIITQTYFFSQMTLAGFEPIAIQHYVEALGLTPDPEVFK